jgi:hypothetical protein
VLREEMASRIRTLVPDSRAYVLANPVDLLAGYPIDPQNLALVDIECRLLSRAVSAPDDSLRERVLEFVCIRSLRRICLTPRVCDYEARLEFLEGVPAYIAERARREGRPYIRGKAAEKLRDALGTPGDWAQSLTAPGGLDWYEAVDLLRAVAENSRRGIHMSSECSGSRCEVNLSPTDRHGRPWITSGSYENHWKCYVRPEVSVSYNLDIDNADLRFFGHAVADAGHHGLCAQDRRGRSGGIP